MHYNTRNAQKGFAVNTIWFYEEIIFMKEYCYKDIREITELGILFKDGFELLFEECRNGWCVEHNLKTGESQCVAERDSLAKIPYFLSGKSAIVNVPE